MARGRTPRVSTSISAPRHGAGFAWRALLIVAPVAGLAFFGMAMLLRDRQRMERDLRAQAARYVEGAADRLWKSLIEMEPQGRPAADAQPASLATRSFRISAKGRLIDPPDFPPVPTPAPPSDDAEDASNARASTLTESAAAVSCYRLGLQSREIDRERAADAFLRVVEKYPDAVGETGLPLLPLAELQLAGMRIAGSPGQAREIRLTLDTLGSNAVVRPTLLTPWILDHAAMWEEEHLGGADVVTRWRTVWTADEARRGDYRAALASIAPVPALPPHDATPVPGHAWPDLIGYLGLAGPEPGPEEWIAARSQSFADGSAAYRCRSLASVELILADLSDSERILPTYLGVRYEVVGRRFPGPNWIQFRTRAGRVSRDADTPEPMATATRGSANGGPGVRIDAVLLDPDALRSHQRSRLMWFASMILGSVVVAIIGLVSTRAAVERQRRLYQMQSDFVSSVTHELRAPIGAVRLMAENFKLGKVRDPVEQQRFFDYMVQECCRLSSMIENVLSLGRIDQARTSYEFAPTDLARLLEDTIRVMEPHAAAANVSLRLEMDSSVTALNDPPIVDGRAVQQALINLVDNALKHAPRDSQVVLGATVAQALRAPSSRQSSSVLRISVADQGPGIPESEHERIFERFYRRGSELRRETIGVGIGLSIVRHIAEAHGGTVRLDSTVGSGSRFILELPLAAPGDSSNDADD